MQEKCQRGEKCDKSILVFGLLFKKGEDFQNITKKNKLPVDVFEFGNLQAKHRSKCVHGSRLGAVFGKIGEFNLWNVKTSKHI